VRLVCNDPPAVTLPAFVALGDEPGHASERVERDLVEELGGVSIAEVTAQPRARTDWALARSPRRGRASGQGRSFSSNSHVRHRTLSRERAVISRMRWRAYQRTRKVVPTATYGIRPLH